MRKVFRLLFDLFLTDSKKSPCHMYTQESRYSVITFMVQYCTGNILFSLILLLRVFSFFEVDIGQAILLNYINNF